MSYRGKGVSSADDGSPESVQESCDTRYILFLTWYPWSGRAQTPWLTDSTEAGGINISMRKCLMAEYRYLVTYLMYMQVPDAINGVQGRGRRVEESLLVMIDTLYAEPWL